MLHPSQAGQVVHNGKKKQLWKKGFKLQISFIPFENNCAIEESAYIQVVSGVTLEDKGFSGSTALASCAPIRSTTDNFMFVFLIQVWPIQQSLNA